MFFDTNNIIEDFTNCMSGENIPNGLENTTIYEWYNEPNSTVDKCSIDIKRYFVIHNFSKGVMYVNYTYKAFDEKGNYIKGSSNIISKWYIQKHNDRWLVTKIKEKP